MSGQPLSRGSQVRPVDRGQVVVRTLFTLLLGDFLADVLVFL